MANTLKLTRDQLAQFLSDHQQIKQFEKLFGLTDEYLNSGMVDAISIEAGNAGTAANDALSQVSRLAQLLDLVAYHPPIERNPGVVADYIDLPVAGPHVTHARRIQWNGDDGTVDIGLNADVTLQVGQETHYFAKNTSGATIPNGTPVIVTGTIGASGKLEIAPALGDGSVEQRYFIGAATQDIADNDFGYVTAFGLLRGFDTSAWADGDLLYVSDTVAGDWTDTEPSAPSWRQAQAIVVHAHSNGSIFVRATPEHRLAELQDVYAPAPANGDVLKWVTANNRWESGAVTAPGSGYVTRSITATGSVNSTDYLILANATGGAITVNLPAVASSAGRGLVVKKTDASGNAVTLDGSGAETIDGAATQAITAQYDALMVVCDGSAWWIV